MWPDLGEKYSAKEPHGMLLTTYLNPAALDGLLSKEGSMPDGAIIVKENYTAEEELQANTVMYKKSGYNPEHNDWFWLKCVGRRDGGGRGSGGGVSGVSRAGEGQRLHLDGAFVLGAGLPEV